ncbi:MAG: hypothetical protein R3F30_08970 [Planctomycetota bacterium]
MKEEARMDALINLLVLLTILSVAAERLANLMKLRTSALRRTKETVDNDPGRELGISLRSIAVGILLAVAVKADLFVILNNLEDPFKSLGWFHVDNYRWLRSPALSTVQGCLYAVFGCVLTGVALGFGSSFWHDILGTVKELKNMTRERKDSMKVQ